MSVLAAVVSVLADAKPYEQPNEWNYVFGGWFFVSLGVVLYAVLLLRRGRRLARQVPLKDRRWMS